jgi:hypothetical protein
MRSHLPRSVKPLVEFITNQQAHAIAKLAVRSVLEGISVNDRDSVIYAIYVDACSDAVLMKDLSKSEIEEIVGYVFVDDFSTSSGNSMLPLTLRHCTMAHYLRLEEDRNWKRVFDLSIESLKGGDFAPSLADIIGERSITWDANRLNRMVNEAITPDSGHAPTALKHILNCPYCNASLQIGPISSKTEVNCPACRRSFNVQP